MLNCLDLHTGIGGFHVAAQRNGRINTILASEIDPYNNKLIDQNLNIDNAGDINNLALSSVNHPDRKLMDEDLVPVEETGCTSVNLEDFFEGALPFPDIATSGFPCQNISPANLGDESGINGSKSGLITENLRIFEDLEIPILVLENSERLNKKGLDVILSELNRMGYIVEWETISAAAFAFPHYRHRLFIVAYLPDTDIAKAGYRVFDGVRFAAQYYEDKSFRLPLADEDPDFILKHAVVENTRSIKLRTKRINGLGNAVVPEIPYHIFNAITADNKQPSRYSEIEQPVMCVDNGKVVNDKGVTITNMPTRGYMRDGVIFTPEGTCPLLNVSKRQYKNLWSTLVANDSKNNCTTKSRLNRPGKLGGLTGDIMRIGADKGGLHPEFCEIFMGFEKGHTELR